MIIVWQQVTEVHHIFWMVPQTHLLGEYSLAFAQEMTKGLSFQTRPLVYV